MLKYTVIKSPLNDEVYLSFKFRGKKQNIMCCDWVTVKLHTPQGSYIVSKNHLTANVQDLVDHIEFLEKEKMELQGFTNENIGLLWNQHLRNVKAGSKEWAGKKYLLWSTPASIGRESWLYTLNNKIIFQVSRCYQWHFTTLKDKKKSKNFISYQSFIRNYVPLAIIEVNPIYLKMLYAMTAELCKRGVANYNKEQLKHEAQHKDNP